MDMMKRTLPEIAVIVSIFLVWLVMFLLTVGIMVLAFVWLTRQVF
jgi:hypothetical protein